VSEQMNTKKINRIYKELCERAEIVSPIYSKKNISHGDNWVVKIDECPEVEMWCRCTVFNEKYNEICLFDEDLNISIDELKIKTQNILQKREEQNKFEKERERKRQEVEIEKAERKQYERLKKKFGEVRS